MQLHAVLTQPMRFVYLKDSSEYKEKMTIKGILRCKNGFQGPEHAAILTGYFLQKIGAVRVPLLCRVYNRVWVTEFLGSHCVF